MTDNLINAIIAVVASIISLATISVILSKQANTSGVISSASTGLGNLIKAATSPVTGGVGSLGSLPSIGGY